MLVTGFGETVEDCLLGESSCSLLLAGKVRLQSLYTK